MEGKCTTFLFTDTQIVVETMLEDLNNVLNSGEIPNLFPQDEQVGGKRETERNRQIVRICHSPDSSCLLVRRLKDGPNDEYNQNQYAKTTTV